LPYGSAFLTVLSGILQYQQTEDQKYTGRLSQLIADKREADDLRLLKVCLFFYLKRYWYNRGFTCKRPTFLSFIKLTENPLLLLNE